jgi:MHS family proline/betaine transporter-like MFS transporter
LAPYISAQLAALTGASWAPSLYVMFGSVVAIVTLATIRDVRLAPLAD